MSNEITTTTPPDARPAAAYLASLTTEVSRDGMRSELAKIARIMGVADWHQVNWATLNAANVAAVLAKTGGAPASRNKTRAALRGVARAAWRLGLISSEELERINDLKPVRGFRELTGRDIEAWELAALMRTCADDKSPAGIRDAAIIALAAKTGARREELCKINFTDISLQSDGDGGCYEISVIGKGNKQRVLYADNGACKALRAWLALRGDAPGALFVGIAKGGRVSGRGMTTTALHKMLMKRAGEAGVANITWHDFRRTFAGALLTAGEDVSTVAQLMGHSNVTTTARYDRRPAEQRRKAARKISVPYFGR